MRHEVINEGLTTRSESLDPPEEVRRLFLENGGAIVAQRAEHNSEGPRYHYITFELPTIWAIPIFFPREIVHPALREFTEPVALESLKYIVPTEGHTYGVFFIMKEGKITLLGGKPQNKLFLSHVEVRSITSILDPSIPDPADEQYSYSTEPPPVKLLR